MIPEQTHFDFGGNEDLVRVSGRIAVSIIDFCRKHRFKRFYADDLRKHVIRQTGLAAPASADRVLRDLRKQGAIGYVVISRKLSLYEVTGVYVQ